MKAQNIKKVADLITKRIGFTISNEETAVELLKKYPVESETKKVINLIVKNGISNSELIFEK